MFEEEVNGIVIGQMTPLYRGRLFYNDRPQGEFFYAKDEQELITMARTRKHDLIAQCGQAAYLIYTDDSKWELRIYE